LDYLGDEVSDRLRVEVVPEPSIEQFGILLDVAIVGCRQKMNDGSRRYDECVAFRSRVGPRSGATQHGESNRRQARRWDLDVICRLRIFAKRENGLPDDWHPAMVVEVPRVGTDHP
jgi:hypothetical protein